jgi:hypothetical protein
MERRDERGNLSHGGASPIQVVVSDHSCPNEPGAEPLPSAGADAAGFLKLPPDRNGDLITLAYETFGDPMAAPMLLIQVRTTRDDRGERSE